MESKTCKTLLVMLVIAIFPIMILEPNLGNTGNSVVLDQPVVEVFRGGKTYAFMFSWDDGGDDLNFSFFEDELSFKHTTFAVTSRIWKRQLWGLDMMFRGHDIQSHSREHLHHATLNESYLHFLLSQSIWDIEQVYGFTPILFAYPYGSQDADSRRLVLEYFKLGRGIYYETDSNRGTWPIENLGNCLHSFPGIDGVVGNSFERLVPSFNNMVESSNGNHRAYKCYGHSKWFTTGERQAFFEQLREIAFRNDTWYTSWGDAVAYQIEKDHVRIESFSYNNKSLSFRTNIDSSSRFGVPLTYRIEIPVFWNNIYVLDGNKKSDSYCILEEGNRTFLLLDSIPQNQTIQVGRGDIDDFEGPKIQGLRTLITDEGVAFIADITDKDGFVKDVNFTIRGNGEEFKYYQVVNPIFWSNSTFGRVIFNLASGSYSFSVTACDSSGNIESVTRSFCIC